MGALPPLETPTRKGGTLPLHGAHTAFSCYPALRLYRLSKSPRGIDVVSLTLGNSVYFAGPTGPMKAFLDRAFFVCSNSGGLLRHKVGAAVTAVRRAGGIQALDALNRYLMYSEMLLPSSNYWSLVYGRTPGQAAADAEGVQTLRLLGENMAWLMKVTAQGRSMIPPPQPVEKCMTNFIR
ncbi:flavodoxin family protein [Flavonifractor sp. HCP28S3_F3]|uniref:flavodoxin family protein n=1 Tax=Flavonifractor sp. HCP28S3_F3 TaxID=3438939 RepID=UPI003F897E87